MAGALVRARLATAARVAEELSRAEPVVAALVVGSTALGRCSPRADLDLVVVGGHSGHETRHLDGVRVEIERIGEEDALAATTGGGWVWELRVAARLGTGIPVYDPSGFAARLAPRAAAMRPDPERFEATLGDVYLVLAALAGSEAGAPRRADALRGCLDNLALLTLLERPRRYQKPKWVVDDLRHSGEDALADALLASYSGAAPIEAVRQIVEHVYERTGTPHHETLLALGFTEELAEASYVSRTLDDAEDLAASGRLQEAGYVARFAARLAAGLLPPGGDIVGTFEELAPQYLALFDNRPDAEHDLLDAALTAADARRDALRMTA